MVSRRAPFSTIANLSRGRRPRPWIAEAREENNPYPDENSDDENSDDDDSPTDGEPEDGGKRRKKGKRAKEPDEPVDNTPDRDEAARALRSLRGDAYQAAVAATAAAIVLAGKRARTGQAGVELPPEGSMARAIIDAGRRRRGEIE